MQQTETILVLDFGGQYDQLIARRVREQKVYAEIRAYDRITPDEIKKEGYRGIIFTGGPNSVYDPTSPHYDPAGRGVTLCVRYSDIAVPSRTGLRLKKRLNKPNRAARTTAA